MAVEKARTMVSQNVVKKKYQQLPKILENYFRMTEKTFENLVNLVSPNLSKEDRKFRKFIPVQKRVAIAL